MRCTPADDNETVYECLRVGDVVHVDGLPEPKHNGGVIDTSLEINIDDDDAIVLFMRRLNRNPRVGKPVDNEVIIRMDETDVIGLVRTLQTVLNVLTHKHGVRLGGGL